MQAEEPSGRFFSSLSNSFGGHNELLPLEDIRALVVAHDLELTSTDAQVLREKLTDIEKAGLQPRQVTEAIAREFHASFCENKPVREEHKGKVEEIRERIKLTDNPEHVAERERVNLKLQESLKNEREAAITKLEKRHSHFGGNVAENFRNSTPWEIFGRVTAVGLGVVLLGKSCTYDRHKDQEGREPNAATKWLDMGAGIMLTLAGLCILPNKKGPQRDIVNAIRSASAGPTP